MRGKLLDRQTNQSDNANKFNWAHMQKNEILGVVPKINTN